MTALWWIIGASLAGGVLSVVCSCTSQSSWWQCRHSSNFSSVKNSRIPASTVPLTAAALLPVSIASGRMLRNTAPSSAPMA